MTKSRTPKSTKKGPETLKDQGPAGTRIEGVDRIRDILFGSHITDYEGRFEKVEEAIERLASELNSAMEERFNSLQRQLEQHVSRLSDLLKEESKSRGDSVEGLDEKFRIQGESLHNELQKRFDELSELLERRFGTLDLTKVDRTSMAKLLSELAAELNADSEGEDVS